MKASELRIGNLVLINGKPIVMDIKMFHAVIHGFYGYNPSPIPLTEEWLLKFGFEKYSWGWSIPQKGSPSFESDDNNELYLSINGGEFMQGIAIKYVHQLQNLYFALTGEELTIKE